MNSLARFLVPVVLVCPAATSAEPPEAAGSGQEGDWTTREIRYFAPEAGEVFLIWGVDGWIPVPAERRSPGTVIRDGLMRSPMVREDGAFHARVQVPVGAALDFGFLTTRKGDGTRVQAWDTGGEGILPDDGRIEREARLTFEGLQPVLVVDKATLVTRRIRYVVPGAGKVLLVWGVEGWTPLPGDARPEGTFVYRGVMHTAMESVGDTFEVASRAPSGSRIHYGFLITESADGFPVEVWVAPDEGEFTAVASPGPPVEVVDGRNSTGQGTGSADRLSQLSGAIGEAGPRPALLFLLLLTVYLLGGRRVLARLPSALPSIGQPESPRAPAVTTSEALCFLGISSLALLVRLPGVNRGFGFDELYTAYHFVDVASVWTTVSTFYAFNNHVGYSLLARLGRLAFGEAEWALRIPALLMGLSGVWALWWAGRSLRGSGVGLAAALGLAISPFHVLYSRSARGYTGLVLLSLLSSFFFLRLLRRPRKRDQVLYVLCSVAAIYCHLYAAWVVAAQALTLGMLLGWQAYARRREVLLSRTSFRSLWLSLPAVAVLTGLLYLPVLSRVLATLEGRGGGQFLPIFPVEVLGFLAGSDSILGILLGLLALGGLMVFWRDDQRAGLYFLLLFLLPLVANWALLRPEDLYTRFFLYFIPYYVLLLVFGAVAIWKWLGQRSGGPHRLWTRGALALAGVLMVGRWGVVALTYIPTSGYRDAVVAMETAGDAPPVICMTGADAEMFQYYAAGPAVVPRTPGDLRNLVEGNPRLRCAHHDVAWNSREDEEMGRFLRSTASGRVLYRGDTELEVYTYGTEEGDSPRSGQGR